jgi:hypothetical protein
MDGDKEIRVISTAVVAIVSQRTSYPGVVPLSEALSPVAKLGGPAGALAPLMAV